MEDIEQNKPLNNIEKGKPTKRKQILWFCTILSLLIALVVVFANKWSSDKIIKQISIIGNSYLPREELSSKVQDTFLNKPKSKVGLNEIKKRIDQDPFVKESFVTHDGSETIKIEIKERQPVAVILDDKGDASFVDETASIMPYHLFQKFSDLPLIRNVMNSGKIDSLGLSQALKIIEVLKYNEFQDVYNNTSEIVYNKSAHQFEIVTADFGLRVLIGYLDNLYGKFKKLSAFRKSQLALNRNTVKYLDLRWSNQVVVGDFVN